MMPQNHLHQLWQQGCTSQLRSPVSETLAGRAYHVTYICSTCYSAKNTPQVAGAVGAAAAAFGPCTHQQSHLGCRSALLLPQWLPSAFSSTRSTPYPWSQPQTYHPSLYKAPRKDSLSASEQPIMCRTDVKQVRTHLRLVPVVVPADPVCAGPAHGLVVRVRRQPLRHMAPQVLCIVAHISQEPARAALSTHSD